MKLYLAGPMTGLPEHNFPAFEAFARELRVLGHEVVSPRELSGETLAKALETPWEHHLRRDLKAMLDCDALAVMPGWERSRGALLEVETAQRVNMPIWAANDLIDEPTLAVPLTEPQLVQAIEQANPPDRVADPVTGAVKADGNKPRTDLLPVRPLLDTAEVFAFGARKYADRNWELGFDWSRPYGALLRHMFLWWSGQDADEETGLSHLAHAACCLMMLQEYIHTHPEKDDRP